MTDPILEPSPLPAATHAWQVVAICDRPGPRSMAPYAAIARKGDRYAVLGSARAASLSAAEYALLLSRFDVRPILPMTIDASTEAATTAAFWVGRGFRESAERLGILLPPGPPWRATAEDGEGVYWFGDLPRFVRSARRVIRQCLYEARREARSCASGAAVVAARPRVKELASLASWVDPDHVQTRATNYLQWQSPEARESQLAWYARLDRDARRVPPEGGLEAQLLAAVDACDSPWDVVATDGEPCPDCDRPDDAHGAAPESVVGADGARVVVRCDGSLVRL